MPDIELRATSEAWPDQDMEVRAVGEGLSFRGYAAVFDSRSEDLGGFREVIRPGAFDKTLRERRGQHMLWNHNPDVVLASTRSRTLRLAADGRGLLAEADLPDDEWGRPVANAVRRGTVDSMSFGFQVVRDVWSDDHKSRELVEVRLLEVSPVVWPAYPETSAAVRHLAQVAGVDEAGLVEAWRALTGGAAPLGDDHRDALVAAINARSATRYVPQAVADDIAARRARLAALSAA